MDKIICTINDVEQSSVEKIDGDWFLIRINSDLFLSHVTNIRLYFQNSSSETKFTLLTTSDLFNKLIAVGRSTTFDFEHFSTTGGKTVKFINQVTKQSLYISEEYFILYLNNFRRFKGHYCEIPIGRMGAYGLIRGILLVMPMNC